MKVFSDVFLHKSHYSEKQHEPWNTYQLLLVCLRSACHVLAMQHHLPQVDNTLLIMSQITSKVFYAAAERIQRQLQDTELNAAAVFLILLFKALN